jgi:hypothetical protein
MVSHQRSFSLIKSDIESVFYSIINFRLGVQGLWGNKGSDSGALVGFCSFSLQRHSFSLFCLAVTEQLLLEQVQRKFVSKVDKCGDCRSEFKDRTLATISTTANE